MPEYNKLEYWNERFSLEEKFEWLAGPEHLLPLLQPYLTSPLLKILHLGCGTSGLSLELYEKGFTNITNVDFSPILIEKQQQLALGKMNWLVVDITKPTTTTLLGPNEWDLIIDKSCTDSVMCGEEFEKVEQQVYQLLREGTGIWWMLSYSAHRYPNQELWEIEKTPLIVDSGGRREGVVHRPETLYYLYALRKKAV